MEHFYAQLSEHDVVVGVSALGGEIDAPNMIPLEKFDDSILGQKYDRDTGEWTPVPTLPALPPVSNEALAHLFTHTIAMLQTQPQSNDTPRLIPFGLIPSGTLEDYGAVSSSANSWASDTHGGFWRNEYMRNRVALYTLETLVLGGVLTRAEVDAMVAERREMYGV